MQAGYFSTAWADIKSTQGWFGKMCLLALLQFVPVFGQIVLLGYAYGWARDIAWNVHKPLPARIFANEDGKLYRRGWFLFLVALVISLVPMVFLIISDVLSVTSSVASHASYGVNVGAGAAAGFAMLFYLIYMVATFAAMFFTWVGSMRASIYDNISAGLQFGKIWKMMRHDGGGLFRIFGMNLIFGLIFGIILFVLSMIVFAICFASVAPQIAALDGSTYYGYSYPYGVTGSNQFAAVLSAILPMLGILFVFIIILAYICCVFDAFMIILTARALGYWTRQFDVAQWGAQADPMPFEAQQQAPYQTYQQPYQAQQPQAQPTQQPQAQPTQAAPVAQPTQPAAAPVAQQEAPAAQPAPQVAPTTPVVATAPVVVPAPEAPVAPEAPAAPAPEAPAAEPAAPVVEAPAVPAPAAEEASAPAQPQSAPAEGESSEGSAPTV